MNVAEMKARIAELETQIKVLDKERDKLRAALAAATTPYQVGDILQREKQIGYPPKEKTITERWAVIAVKPGRGKDNYGILLRNVRKDGTLGERREPMSYLFVDKPWVKVGRLASADNSAAAESSLPPSP